MGLNPNSKLGPYVILSPLGAGGMGEVYRAKDTRLDRDVAIKILPAHLTHNPEFKQRFEREAKSISQLTHPNICTLHDVGHHDGIDYLVMELLEGETLNQRLAKGPLPLDLTLRFGAEIASALDAAHRKGVVHRDLKPGNVVLTKLGAKLLDFGLAKSGAVIDNDSHAVTVTQPLTSKGTLIGTFQYMAPEQLEGAEADARTDIFALGALLYEMATGRRAFAGASRASLIASIMTAQPRPISEIQPLTPPALDRLIRKCLAKDPDGRWQSATDVADELRWIAEGGSQVGAPAGVRSARKGRQRTWVACTLALGLVCVALSVLLLTRVERPVRRVWSTIPPPDEPKGTTFVASGDLGGPVVISPDGSMMAFVAGSAGTQQLWVRSLSGNSPRLLPGTEGATFPFWSADGRSLGYFAKEKLHTINASGGSPIPLCDASGGRGGSWNRDGVIILAPAFRSPIVRISATGGRTEPITKVDETKHTSHRWPSFCPDGKHFLFLAVAHGVTNADTNALYLGSLDGSEPRQVMLGSANAEMVGEWLVFPRQNTLLASRFELGTATLTGEPGVVATGVMHDAVVWRSAFSVSLNGELVFHSGKTGGEFQPVKKDRSGKNLGKIADAQNFGAIRLSPDGKRLATSVTGQETDLWLYDIDRGMRSRLTFGGLGAKVEPVWSPDGQWVYYANLPLARPSATSQICRRRAMGGDEEVLYEASDEIWPTDASSDGKFLLLGRGKYIGGNPSDIWVLPLEGERKAFPLLKSDFIEANACFSPDGRWVVYDSDETGPREVYVIPFRGSDDSAGSDGTFARGGRWQVSAHGGSWPRWGGNGKELFYLARDRYLTAVEFNVSEGGSVEIGTTSPLFTLSEPAGVSPFDVHVDGQWFVETSGKTEAAAPINLIVNWDEGLEGP